MATKGQPEGIRFFEKYLTVWVIICMIIGILIGVYFPEIPNFLSNFEYAKVSVPVALLIWIMIYPMMLKVDFQSIKKVKENPKGLLVTWASNWLI
ncbi:MAG: arsenical-resistance protein, partial [Alkalibacterium sp.]|nr:arsenical-resistance protein [Alkalibacterium sp.]